ncbi:hypothetical protein [Rhizobium sp. C4]|uniref:hypothetical protein n=1 Tax=Rhizobium sp. C4 TaxID=1349800 RepID=UPI001E618F7F|nr:hypothetical protein [Rhizobium sp. C4]MCD2172417.1 hypothetical protein [Rhizobium sp. C4]
MSLGTASFRQVEERFSETALLERLESARGQLEERFLDGGSVLVTVLDTLSKLVELLDQVGTSLKDEEAKEAKRKLVLTAELLKAVPENHATRQASLAAVKQISGEFSRNIDSMNEALRYLRTFAMTAKIAGANVADFSDFVSEIMERIQFATQEVKTLASRVDALSAQIDGADLKSGGPLENHFDDLPNIVSRLLKNGAEIDAQKQNLSAMALKVADLARKAQAKVGQVLSAMQIGDITRQRIEHCQTAFDIAREALESNEGQRVGADERDLIMATVTRLVAELLAESTADFHRDSGRVVETIHSLGGDVSALMKLYEAMILAQHPERGNPISVLHGDLVAARGMVAKIGHAASVAASLSQNTAVLVGELTTSVETIQLVRRDIQYMALNTTLRCGRLGEEGRPINVVTGELRVFASVLDDDAAQILTTLKQLQQHAAGLSTADAGESDGETESLEGLLDSAVPMLAEAAKTMEDNLQALRLTAEDMSAKVMRAISRLDFKAGIGEIMASCTDEAVAASQQHDADFGMTPTLAAIGERIGKTYTMVAERNIHASVFGVTSAVEEAPAASDDDLLEDALF